MCYYPAGVYESWSLEGAGTWEGPASLGRCLQELSSPGGAAGRTSGMGTPSGSAVASTPTVSVLGLPTGRSSQLRALCSPQSFSQGLGVLKVGYP